MTCPHCGAEHASSVSFCPETGKPLAAAASRMPAAGSAAKGLGDLLGEALRLYRTHAKVFLVTAAIGLLPIYVLHAGLVAVLAPSEGESVEMQARAERARERAERLQREMQSGTMTPERMAREQRQMAEDLAFGARESVDLLARLGLFLLSLLLLVPLTVLAFYLATAALIPVIGDRALGGSLTAAGAWGAVTHHLPGLVLTSALAFLAVAVGLVFCLIPGLIAGFLFSFATAVVLLEGKSGVAALRRSARLVAGDWVRVFVVLFIFGLLGAIAHAIGGLFVPARFLFFRQLLQDLISLVIFPFPIIGLVLLYADIRRVKEGMSEAELQARMAQSSGGAALSPG